MELQRIRVKFHPRERSFLTTASKRNVYCDPVYVHRTTDQGYNVTVYTFYYDENFAIGCGHTFFPRWKCLGYHPVDIEFVAVYEKPGDKRVYFSAHSNEGRWYKWEDCEVIKGVLSVYVALNSHACYPHPGTHIRVGCLANDVTSNTGYHAANPIYLLNYFDENIRKPLPHL